MSGAAPRAARARTPAVRAVLLAGSVACALAFSPPAATRAAAAAREVIFPLTVDFELLRQTLLAQVFTDAEQTARVWDDGTGCNELVLSDPTVGESAEGIRIESRGRAKAGFPVLSFCLFSLDWEGFVEVVEEPELERGKQIVRFRVVDSNLYGTEREKQLATGVIWDWVKEHVQPRLGVLHVDLGAPLREIAELLPLFLAPESAERTRRLLESVEATHVRTTEIGLRVDVRFEVEEAQAALAHPPAPRPSAAGLAAAPAPGVDPGLEPPAPAGASSEAAPGASAASPSGAAPGQTPVADVEPPLTPAEIAAFALALRQVDAFLTFVVKQGGADTTAAELREALLEVLLDERYDLVAALATPRRDARDPVREMFLETWIRLAPVLRRVAPTLPAPLAMRYLSFVSAGDALRALDELGPSAGIEVSADGLRRLARIIAPSAPGDPLDASVAVDPELRAVLGFGAPLEPPDVEAPPAETPAGDATPEADGAGAAPPSLAPPAPTATATPAPDAPASPAPAGATTPLPAPPSPGAATGTPAAAREGRHAWRALHEPLAAAALAALARLAPGDADAASKPLSGVDEETVRRLNRWAVKAEDLDAYLPLVRDLLQAVASERAKEDALADRFATLFRALVPATAWQESCWRQFVLRSGQLVPLRSPASAVGIMQVNQNVWRGFYDLDGLRRDLRYNARAGSEILSQYLRRYVAGHPRHARSDETVAEALYAVYNGGPGQLRRFEQGRASKRERAVFASFQKKVARIRAGDALAVRECFTG